MSACVGVLDLFPCDSGWRVCVCASSCVKLSPSVSRSPLEEP